MPWQRQQKSHIKGNQLKPQRSSQSKGNQIKRQKSYLAKQSRSHSWDNQLRRKKSYKAKLINCGDKGSTMLRRSRFQCRAATTKKAPHIWGNQLRQISHIANTTSWANKISRRWSDQRSHVLERTNWSEKGLTFWGRPRLYISLAILSNVVEGTKIPSLIVKINTVPYRLATLILNFKTPVLGWSKIH